jgi:hypothetical protein
MRNSVAVAVGVLVGVGAWLLMSYLDTTGWVSGVRFFAQWLLPIIFGIGTSLMIHFSGNFKNTK